MRLFLLFFAALFLALGSTQSASAHPALFMNDLTKEYISTDQIIMNENGLFFSLKGKFFKILEFTEDSDQVYHILPSYYWNCRECAYDRNPEWSNHCKKCEKRFDEMV